MLVGFQNRLIAIDLSIASACASLHIPDKKPDRDAFIAATAMEHKLTLVTRNIKNFFGVDVNLLNPWS